jgi:hypothetical protein
MTLSSGSLTQWNDKSGNGRNLTAISGYANATVSSAFQNGLNVFNFSGNGLYRTAGGAVVYPQDCYIVVALKSTTAHVDVLGMGDTGNDNFNSLTFGEYSASRWHNGSSGFSRTPNCVSSTTENSTSFLLIQWSIANNNFLLRRNGTQLVQTASYTYGFNNSSTSVFQIGFRHTNLTAANFSGYIGEIIVFNSQLGTTQQQQVESYLAQKWGLVGSLPSGHPALRTIIYRAPRAITLTMTPFFTGFTPRQIPGLGLWLDGADSSSITTATGVSQWNDKSGNGYNLTQGNTGSQPTRTGNLLNFVSNYNMNIPQAAVNNASTWSMFFLVNPIASVNWFMAKQRDGVNSYNIFSTTQTGGPGPNAYFTGSTNFLYVRMFNAGTLAASAAALTMSQLQLLAFIYDGTSMFIYINGNLSSTTVGSFAIQNDTSATNFLLGQWFGNGTNYNSSGNFQLGELIYFNTFLAATQRQQIESYLAQKWGLVSSLPGGHLNATRPAGARTALSLTNSKFTVTPRPYSPIVATVGNFTSIVGGAAGGGLWMTAVTPNGDIYTKSYNPTVYRLSGATYSNPFSCDNWGQGLTTDGSFVYGTDTNSAQIFRFNPATSTRNLMINSIASPCGLAADGIGNIYISQQIWQNPNNTIYRYNIAANTTTMLYNVSLSTYYFAGMAPDGLGNVYLSDYVTNKIYKLNSSNVLSTVAGSGTAGFADGTGAAASFNISMYINFSNNLCYDGNGNLYLAETNNNRIRKIVIATAVVTTIAGTGVSGTVDGPGLTARLAAPLGISYANGFLYWCEDKLVRRLTL